MCVYRPRFNGVAHGDFVPSFELLIVRIVCTLQKGCTLFTLPRTITLSTRTSPLPSLFGFNAWCAHGLHKGWVGLILCMMWEDAWAHELDATDGDAQGQHDIQTKWGPYLRTLPTTFDTPMFWSAEELEELQGTAVVGRPIN